MKLYCMEVVTSRPRLCLNIEARNVKEALQEAEKRYPGRVVTLGNLDMRETAQQIEQAERLLLCR